MIPSFQKLQMTDRVLQSLQANVASVLSALFSTPIVQGASCSYTVPTGGLAAGATFAVNHGLDKAVTAVFPAMCSTVTSLTLSTDKNSAPTLQFLVTTSAALAAGLTLNFWVT